MGIFLWPRGLLTPQGGGTAGGSPEQHLAKAGDEQTPPLELFELEEHLSQAEVEALFTGYQLA